jgi:hypothetical protein
MLLLLSGEKYEITSGEILLKKLNVLCFVLIASGLLPMTDCRLVLRLRSV